MASASVVMIRESIEGIISKKISVDLSAISISLVAGMASFTKHLTVVVVAAAVVVTVCKLWKHCICDSPLICRAYKEQKVMESTLQERQRLQETSCSAR